LHRSFALNSIALTTLLISFYVLLINLKFDCGKVKVVYKHFMNLKKNVRIQLCSNDAMTYESLFLTSVFALLYFLLKLI